MKRVFLAIAVMGVSISSALGQVKKEEKPTPAGTVRVAIVNIGVVFHKYEKALEFKKEIEERMRPFKNKAKALTEQAATWHEELKKANFDPTRKDELDANILRNKHQLEEMQQQVKNLLAKKQEDNLMILWKDVQYEVKTYAVENNIDLVLAYGDPSDKESIDQFPNVNRKMQAMDQGSIVPLFVAKGVDIAEPVAARLNKKYEKSRGKSKRNAVDLE